MSEQEVRPDAFGSRPTNGTASDVLADLIKAHPPKERAARPMAVVPAPGVDAAPVAARAVSAAPAAVAVPARRSRTERPAQPVTPAAESGEKTGRKNVLVPDSLYTALCAACEIHGASMTEVVLSALNRQERNLAGVFPPRVDAGESAAVPVRVRTRRRKDMSEPTRPVTLYLNGVEADAVAAMIDRLNAGSRSNLVTEALRLDLSQST